MKNITVGIDIGTHLTRVVVCDTSSGALPTVIGSSVVESRGLRHGYVVNRDEAVTSIKAAIKAAELDAHIRIRSANLSIGGSGLASEYASGSTVVTRADGIISKFDIEKAIENAESTLELKNKTILHAFPVMFKVDGKELPTRPEGTAGTKLEVKVLFITVFEQHLDDLLWVVGEAGVKVTGYTATPIAPHKLLLSDLQRNFGCALIDIGAETVSVAVFEANTLTSLHVFGIGSSDITKDIALGLRITPEEAESIKLGVVSFQNVPKKKLDEIVEARLSDIFELVDKYFKKIGRSGLLPAGAVIIGGGSHAPMVESVAKAMLKIPVRIGYLELPTAKSPLKDNRYLVAYGTATSMVESASGGKSSSHSSSGESFMDIIKNFFKQLMP
jgi:cell division protein FtsA